MKVKDAQATKSTEPRSLIETIDRLPLRSGVAN